MESPNARLRAELAAIKAQEPVAELLRGQSAIGTWFDLNVFDQTVPNGTKLYAAPVSEAKAQGVVMPEPDIKTGHGYPAYSVAAVTELFALLNSSPVSSAPSHGGGVAHTDCRSEDGITVGLIDSIITSCRVLSSRDLTCEAVVEALRDLQSDSDVSLIKPSHGEQVREVVPIQWSKSLGKCWPVDEEDARGDWLIGTEDEDGNRYEVVRVEASQYDAEGESQKIAEAIVKLWSAAATAAPAADAWIPVSERLPNIAQEVIVYSEFDGVCAGVLDSYGEWFAPCSEYKLIRVTSWMPMPTKIEANRHD